MSGLDVIVSAANTVADKDSIKQAINLIIYPPYFEISIYYTRKPSPCHVACQQLQLYPKILLSFRPAARKQS
jgi:hypothetical protein